jgi:predicted restriction endonuclease
MKSSKKIKKIVDLNNEIDFDFIVEEMTFKERLNSKTQFDNYDYYKHALNYVDENYDIIRKYIKVLDDRNNIFFDYYKQYKKIMNSKRNKTIECNRFYFRNIEKYELYENALCEKVRTKNINKVNLTIMIDYRSNMGRNYYSDFRYYNSDDMVELLEDARVVRKNKERASYQRSLMSMSLRYDVLKRDNYKCCICGASARMDGVKLEVDHIKPISKGGKTVLNNLQTLCMDCNRGKSNK